MGGIVSVDFGASDTEVIVFSDYSSKVTVWSLESGRAVEIKDPKFSYLTALSLIKLGFGYRPKFCKSVAGPGGGGAGAGAGAGSVNANSKVGVFALLARSAAQDILLLLAPQSYSILKSVPLCTTDAQGIKWSPDGRWLAVWEAASVGYKVYIYTADGNLYRVYGGNISEDGPEEGRITAADRQALGVGSIEWSPKGDSLAIGDHARRVTLLNIRTVSVHLPHRKLNANSSMLYSSLQSCFSSIQGKSNFRKARSGKSRSIRPAITAMHYLLSPYTHPASTISTTTTVMSAQFRTHQQHHHRSRLQPLIHPSPEQAFPS